MLNYKNPSHMTHAFSQVPRAEIPRSVFDRTHSHKTMFSASPTEGIGGGIIPFYVDEVLPGDTFNVDATLFIRMPSALKLPVMDNLFLDTFFFFVPNRLVWSDFQKFCGEKVNPNDNTSYVVPQIVAPAVTGWEVGSLSDYFGLPTGIPGISVSSLWHRAYNLIYNEWFRDQNLINSVPVDKDAGPDSNSDYVLLQRGKRHDYFTSCLPWAQKGTAVNIPLSGNAPVMGIVGNGAGLYPTAGSALGANYRDASGVKPTTLNWGGNFANNDTMIAGNNTTGAPGLYADLSSATAATINSLRQAFQLQKMFERDARGGTRYTEIVLSHFGVSSPDARLQRPEFLGGKSTTISIASVPQMSATDAVTPQGNLAAFASGLNSRDGFTKSFTEHGVILGLCAVRADLTYQQGVPRMFSRSTRFDMYWPALAHIGEQAVLQKEIYATATAAPGDAGDLANNTVFGYQERWAEYRYYPSKITGKLRSTYATPLDSWHLAQEFGSAPTLSPTFINEAPPISRIVAVTDEPEFVMDSYIKCNCVRPMPTYSVPGLIDHF